jgi:hypothetical protein
MFLGRKEKAMNSWKVADPSSRSPPAAPLASDDSMLTSPSGRRRIVAQVRRKVPKSRDFIAVGDSAERCDDLLTTTVDNDDRAGL